MKGMLENQSDDKVKLINSKFLPSTSKNQIGVRTNSANTLYYVRWLSQYNDEQFVAHEENWHNGKTFKYENDLTKIDDRYIQYKTVITNDNQEEIYHIYDEIIRDNNKPVLLFRLYGIKNDEYLESVTYLEKNEVIQQIRTLNHQQFSSEIDNNEKLFKTKESENTIIIKMSFLDFIKSINKKNKVKETHEEKWNWKFILKLVVIISVFVIAWAAIPVIGNLLIAPLLTGLVSVTTMKWLPFVCAGLVVGSVVKGLEKCGQKIKKWFFSNTKDEQDIAIEKKLRNNEKI